MALFGRKKDSAAARGREIDMLHGPLRWKILFYALPLAATSMLEQLFNSVDVAVVGRFASSNALAAVGVNAPVVNLFIALVTGLSLGVNAAASTRIGQRDNEGVRKCVETGAILSVALGLALAAIGSLVATPLLTAMHTPREVLADAVLYLRIFFVALPFLAVFNFCAAVMQSMGDTRRPLYILVTAGVVNTVLNLVFVIVFHMGVAGVAVATAIANALSAFLAVQTLRREREPFRLRLSKIRLDRREMSRMLKIGLPAGLQGMVFSASNLVIQTSINGYGPYAVAGSAAALNFEIYCYYIIAAFNGAAISFIGQNYGAGQMDRVKRVFGLCVGWAVLLSGSLNLLFAAFSPFFLHFFSTDPEVCFFGTQRMHTVLVLQWIACSYEVAAASLRGMGISLRPTLLIVFGTCLLRIVWVNAVCPVWHGFVPLMTVYPVSWTVTGCLMLGFFFVMLRKRALKAAA